MNDLIHKGEFLTSLIHCKKLTLQGLEAVVEHLEKYPSGVDVNKICNAYEKEAEKYKRKYEIAKSGLTREERNTLINLIENEQIKHMIPNNKFETDKYLLLEQLKAKIRII